MERHPAFRDPVNVGEAVQIEGGFAGTVLQYRDLMAVDF